jgi:hypothetical protein
MTLAHLAVVGLSALQAGPEGAAHPPGAEFLQVEFGFHLAGLILSVAAALYACVLALLFLTVFLAPGISQRGSEHVQSSPWRSLLVGVAADGGLILLGAATRHASPLAVIALPILFLLVVGGIAVIAQDIGRRAFTLAGQPGTRLGRIAAGWAVCLLASAIPYLGWIVIGPILLTMGIGGFLLSLFSRASEPKPVPAPAAPAGGGTA